MKIPTLEKLKNDKILKDIKKYSEGVEVYVVGGVIRDLYTGKDNFDKDLIVCGIEAKDYALNLSENLDATFIPLDEENKIYRLVLRDKKTFIDITNPINNSIEEDLKRRDFTINSIAMNIQNFEVLDLNNGLKDLKNKKIKMIDEKNFIEDPLRLLRAYRFQAVTGFEIDSKTEHTIKKHIKLINNPARERITYELMKLFEGAYTVKTLLNMDKAELLYEILPIFLDVRKVPPNTHHHLDLLHHSIETVNQIQNFYNIAKPDVKEHLDSVDFGGFSRLAHLKLAGFMHDIGKYSCWTIEEDTGRHRFIKHEEVGSKLASPILKKLKFSKKQIEYICKMIKNHIYPSHVIATEILTDKVKMRYVRKMEDDVIDNILLAMSDRLSARGKAITDEVVHKNISGLTNLLKFYLEVKDNLEPLPKLLSGEEIMEMLNLKPSKELGEVIKALQEEQFNGEITTKEQAIEFVKKYKL